MPEGIGCKRRSRSPRRSGLGSENVPSGIAAVVNAVIAAEIRLAA